MHAQIGEILPDILSQDSSSFICISDGVKEKDVKRGEEERRPINHLPLSPIYLLSLDNDFFDETWEIASWRKSHKLYGGSVWLVVSQSLPGPFSILIM